MSATDAQQRRAVADIDAEAAVDRAVEAYEQARLAGEPVDLAQFAPQPEHPQYADVACELMRVDLEYAWDAGEHKGIEDYRAAFAAALERPTVAERVAFEEYRLRSHASEVVSPADFCERYGIDTSRWPMLSGTNGAATAPSRSEVRDNRDAPNCGVGLDDGVEFPTTPGRFLDFELVLELGRGAFARVYLARQSELAQRFVVLKVSRSFSDEPQRLAQLQHTNIVPIYSVHHVGALRVVCMPFFGGATLADLLAPFGHGNKMPASGREFVSTLIAARQSTLVADGPKRSGVQSSASPPTEALREMSTARSTSADPSLLAGLERSSYVDAVLLLAEQLTDGLTHAHQRGVVHRDIKPANVLVTDEGRAMLLDFNLAATTEATPAANRSLGGTLAYMPPEMLDALASDTPPAAANPRGDVYAVGVLLFEMLTGRLPFPTANGPIREVAARMAADRRAGLSSVRALNPAVPRAVEAIVRKCLAFDPAARYASAEELHDDLLRQRQNLPLLHVREPSLLERCAKWSRRHPRIASATTVALAASMFLLASLGAWWYRGEELALRDAVAAATELHRDVLAWRIPLGTHDLDARSLDETLRRVDELLADHQVLETGGWRNSPAYRRLSPSGQAQVDRDAGELCYLAAAATYRSAFALDEADRHIAIERAIRINDAALTTLASFGDDDDSTLRSSLARQRDVLAAALTNQAPSLAAATESSTPKSTSDVYLTALGHIERGNFAAAVSLVQPRVASDPRDYALRYALAQAHRGQGDIAAAIDEFTACTALAPESHLAFFYRGLCRLEREDFRGARRDFDDVLRLAPDLPAGLLNRAVTRERLGDISGAIADLSASLANGITETRVYFLRARLLDKLGDKDGAQRDRQEGFRRPPRDETSFLARGVAHLPFDANSALAEFQAALARYPESIAARRNIAHVLSEHLGRPVDAIAELDVVAKRRPRDAAAIVGRGVLLARLGRRDEAHRDGETALQASRDGQTVYQAACIYALTSSTAVEDAPKALKLLAEALLVDPRSARIAATDADLRAIANEPEFRRLLAAAATLDRARSAEVKSR